MFLYPSFTLATSSAKSAPKVLKCSKLLSPFEAKQDLTIEIALYNLGEGQQELAFRSLKGYENFLESKALGGLNEAFGSLRTLVSDWLLGSRKSFQEYEEVLVQHKGKAMVYGENGNYKKSKAFNSRYKEGLAIAFLVKTLISKGLNSAASGSKEWQGLAFEISESTELLQYGLRIHRMEAGTHILYGLGEHPIAWDIPAHARPEKVAAPRLNEPGSKDEKPIPSILF